MKSSKPKVAHEILGKPLVRWVVDAAHSAGIDSVVSIVGHGRDQVEPLLSDTTMVVQEEQLGTAHAVLVAREALAGKSGSLVVLTGDSPLVRPSTIEDLVRTREENNAAVVVLTMEASDPFGYGRIVRDDAGDVVEIVEQKDCTPEQGFIASILNFCFQRLKKFQPIMRRVNNTSLKYWESLVNAVNVFWPSRLKIQRNAWGLIRAFSLRKLPVFCSSASMKLIWRLALL